MHICRFCREEIPADDVDFVGRNGTCICRHCVLRLAGFEAKVDPWLRKEVEAAMKPA